MLTQVYLKRLYAINTGKLPQKHPGEKQALELASKRAFDLIEDASVKEALESRYLFGDSWEDISLLLGIPDSAFIRKQCSRSICNLHKKYNKKAQAGV